MLKINTKYRTDEPEIMDDFLMEGEVLQDALDKIAKINQFLGGNQLTLQGVESLLKNHNKNDEVTIVDIGCGNGDMLRKLADYAIKNNPKEQGIIKGTISRFNSDMLGEVENINGDVNGIIKSPFEAVVKFKLEDLSLFDEPIYQPSFDLVKFKRFQPYQLTDSIEGIFENGIDDENSGFVYGKSSQTSVYNRRNKESSIIVERVHTEIVEALEIFLRPTYSLRAKNISIETTRFKGNIADIVTKENDCSITIYEIKTSASGRRNIRDAIAQLLDYALHSVDRVNKLLIVSPSVLTKGELAFLGQLKTKIDFPLEYLCYQKDSSIKFIKQ